MSEKKPNEKKKYVKPELKRIRLDSEVLLVAGCKLASSRSSKGCKNNACAAPNRLNGS